MPKTIELFLSAKTQTLLEVNFYFSVSEVGHLESKISLISAGVIVRMTCENSINNINIGIYFDHSTFIQWHRVLSFGWINIISWTCSFNNLDFMFNAIIMSISEGTVKFQLLSSVEDHLFIHHWVLILPTFNLIHMIFRPSRLLTSLGRTRTAQVVYWLIDAIA